MRISRSHLFLGVGLLILFVAGYGNALAHTVSGTITCANKPGWALSYGTVQVYEVDVLPGDVYRTDPHPLATGPISANGTFMVTFPWVPIAGPPVPPDYESGGPDLTFVFTQNLGSLETIYEELPEEVHWNVADGSILSFEVDSDLASCSYPGVGLPSIPNNMLFLFTRIGNCETAETDCRGSNPSSSGYYHAQLDGYSGNDSDVPFGRTLDLFGWFGKSCQMDYYKVLYSTNGGMTWTEVETSLPNKWYDTSDPNPLNWKWVSESMGPFEVDGIKKLYTVPHFVRPNTPWSYLDRVARFNSTLVPDWLCLITIEAYKWVGGHLALATSSDIIVDANYGEIKLQIDNTAPTVSILDLKLNGASQAACSILEFGTASSDTIAVDFRVWDQQGHLRSYSLNAMYGHNSVVSPIPTNGSDSYASHSATSPSWQGSTTYTAEYTGSSYSAAVMPSCAYQFRLAASKRTTNGYGLIYSHVEDTWHVTIERP